MTVLSFFVPGAARGKGRPKFASRGKFVTVYTDKETMNAEAWVRLCATQALGQPRLEGPLALRMHISVEIPASWSNKKRAAALSGALKPTGKPDGDNSLKLAADSLNKLIWIDDSQIVDMRVIKFYGVDPWTHIEVETL